jgi:hypothetical protein
MFYLFAVATKDGSSSMSVTQSLRLSKIHNLSKNFRTSNSYNKNKKIKINSCIIQALFQLHIGTFPKQDLKYGMVSRK